MMTYQRVAGDTDVSIPVVKAVAKEYHIKHKATTEQLHKVYAGCQWIARMREDLIDAFDMTRTDAEKEAYADWLILKSQGVKI